MVKLRPGQLWLREGPNQLLTTTRRDSSPAVEAGVVGKGACVVVVTVNHRMDDAIWARTEALLLASNGVLGWTVFLPEYWKRVT